MASTIGTAYVQIQPKATGIKQSLEQEVGKPAESAGKDAGSRIGKFAKVAIVAAGIGKAIQMSVSEGAKLEQSIGGVETLYKKSADTVIKNADRAYKTAGLSANEYMEQSTTFAASLLQSVGGNTEKAAKYADMAIIDMSDNANKMGTDIESIQNAYQGFAKQNYTMLDNLKLGYGGTKEEMGRLLEDAGKISGQKYDISNLSDVYEAIHVMQGELDITGTTSKEAAETISGSFASMKSAATNLMGNLALGRDVNSSFSELMTSTSTFVSGNLIPMIGTLFNNLPTLLSGIIHQGIPALLSMLADVVPNIINWISTQITSISAKISTALMTFAQNPSANNAGIGLVKNLIGGIVKTMPRLVVAIVKAVPMLVTALLAAGARLVSVGVKWIANLASGIVSSAVTKIKSAAETVKNTFMQPINALKDKVKGVIDKIKSFFSFSVSKPNIPIPHFGILPKGWKLKDLLKGSIPSLSIDWYANGGIVDGASLIGAGEAGAEGIVPLDPFWAKLDSFRDDIVASVSANNGGGEITAIIQLDGQTIGQSTVNYINGQTVRFGANPLAV